MAKINVTYFSADQQHRYTGGQTSNQLFAGNFGTVLTSSEYVLYLLDEADMNYVSRVPLKDGEVIYRMQTDRMRAAGLTPLVKINMNNGLVYFLTPDEEEEDGDMFERRGVRLRYINLKK